MTTMQRYEREYLNAFFIAPMLGVVLVFFTVMYCAVGGGRFNYDFDQNVRIMSDFVAAEKQADLSVVLIGNSRLRNGVNFGFDPKELLTLPDGRKMASIQYADNGAQFASFVYLEGHILNAHPDFLVIVDSILTNSPATDNLLVNYARIVAGYVQTIMFKTDYHKAWWEGRTEPEKNCYEDFTRRMMQFRIETTSKRDHHSLNEVDNKYIPEMRRFIDLAVKNRIKVIILNIPPNSEVLDQFGVSADTLDFYGLGFHPAPEQLLPDTYKDVTWLNYKHPNGKEDYCDFVHFNETGRNIFSDWLKNQLSRMK